MESSEDDAGGATNASRRPTAREKDYESREDGGSGASGENAPQAMGSAAASDTASASEEAFDGDSMPSPSMLDVNTSTEALLDMIDEIVEGPDAPKRLSLSSLQSDSDEAPAPVAQQSNQDINLPPTETEPEAPQHSVPPPSSPAKCEIVEQDSTNTVQPDNITPSDAAVCVVNTDFVEPEASSSVPVTEAEESIKPLKGAVSLEIEESNNPPQNIPSSSVTETLESVVHTNDSQTSERTIKCVTSSDNRDNVTVGSAESTSSDNSVSESRSVGPETFTRPPQRRRLVRPAPSDRRPDSTVSSTADSHSANVHTTEQTTGECLVKDVSSSSDALPPVYVKPEEISNVSEINVCKAETSMGSPSKKIKLIRQKIAPPALTLKEIIASPIVEEKTEQCESTSSDSISSVLPQPEGTSSTELVCRTSPVVDSECIEHVPQVSTPTENKTDDLQEDKSQVSSVPAKVDEKSANILPECAQESKTLSVLSENSESLSETAQEQQPPVESGREVVTNNESEQCNMSESESIKIVDENVPETNVSIVSSKPEEHLTEGMHGDKDFIVNDQARPSTPVEPPQVDCDDNKKVPPIKLNLTVANSSDSTVNEIKIDIKESMCGSGTSQQHSEQADSTKQVPKLTIKLSNKQPEEQKSPIPKLTIKAIKQPCVSEDVKSSPSEQIPNITKINIKPISKPAEKVNDTHRKSSSSEISESESSENDESNSTSDQTSTSDHGLSDTVPKVTIKLGKPGTVSEGKFYTEPNIPKLTIKGIQQMENADESSTLKLVITQPEEKSDKIPKFTIKGVNKSENQPLSPKLTIKPIKPPENLSKDVLECEVQSIPKITIKPIVKTDSEPTFKSPKKSIPFSESTGDIPVVTKLNIKPVIKPAEVGQSSNTVEDKLPVVSKINIKPIVKPTENDITETHNAKVPVVSKLNIKPIVKPPETVLDNTDIPVVSKLNIKPLVKPADKNEPSDDSTDKIPIVAKLNIKPIVKPVDSDSDGGQDSIPVVSKLNIKPIVKPTSSDDTCEIIEEKVPVISKLNIKPIVKPKDNDVDSSVEDVPKVIKLNIKPLKNPEDNSSEKKDCDELNAINEQNNIPVVTKLNIKPLVKPRDDDTLKDSENQSSETGNSSDDNENIPVVTKLNIKPIVKPHDIEEPAKSSEESIPIVTKLTIKTLLKSDDNKSLLSPKREGLRSADSKTPSVPLVTKLNIKPVVRPEVEAVIEAEDSSAKNPPLVMKINMKAMAEVCSSEQVTKMNSIDTSDHAVCNNVSPKGSIPSKIEPLTISISDKMVVNCKASGSSHSPLLEINKQNCVSPVFSKGRASPRLEKAKAKHASEAHLQDPDKKSKKSVINDVSESNQHVNSKLCDSFVDTQSQTPGRQATVQNCTLLKKLLETKKDGLDNRLEDFIVNANHSPIRKDPAPATVKEARVELSDIDKLNEVYPKSEVNKVIDSNKIHDVVHEITSKSTQDFKEPNASLTTPLEINISDKITNQGSGQDSPRIILKINKTDHGPSAKIITEETKRPDSPKSNDISQENTQEIGNDKPTPKKSVVNSRRKQVLDMPSMPMGKRLRSSRIVEENTPIVKRNIGKRASTADAATSPPASAQPELSVLESKRLKLGQLLSNTQLTVTPVSSKAQQSPPKPNLEIKQGNKTVNHTLLNNENCSKNGNSKLHNILSNLQVKQAQALSDSKAFNDSKTERRVPAPELDSNTSTGSDVVEIVSVEPARPVEMVINESSESRDFAIAAEDASQDPLDTGPAPPMPVPASAPALPMTPQPKKRGRPRKLPASEGPPAAPPAPPPALPVPALEERPQRSLRLSRERPAILVKSRGGRGGRGRGAKRAADDAAAEARLAKQRAEELDPTSSRVKLPRMTEALDKMPGGCSTPLSSRRRVSDRSESVASEGSDRDVKLVAEGPELKVVLENTLPSSADGTPRTPGADRGGRPLRGPGSRGGKIPPPRIPGGRRGRGGGRGAMYMKETMGIYGRVCGPATTTVQLFEEETCMMDDNATPAKPSHLMDEDSQSSVKSSTNESSKIKKSKFDELFDSNRKWTAADVKEYTWPPPEKQDPDNPPITYMIEEQVSLFLRVRDFRRGYPALKRRDPPPEEREHIVKKGVVDDAMADVGITAVDASNVLDIMLSDYPHKYEEYRSHLRERQLAAPETPEPPPKIDEARADGKMERIEMKETKPEPSKADLEKSRQDMAAAAIASASEFNSRLNAQRRPACADMQSGIIHRRRIAMAAPEPTVVPRHGFYPHALLPGQYQHSYRVYTAEQLRYFPLNTALSAPPAAADSADSADSDDSRDDPHPAKRKKLTKKRSRSPTPPRAAEESCRACGLRLEANRKHTHERFLVCVACQARLHPGCVDLPADTIRKCREYDWQCATCKTCGQCGLAADGANMLFCDLCDRGFHCYCVGLPSVPQGRWHCVECAICKSCGAREPAGLPAEGDGAATPATPGTPATPATPGTPAGCVSAVGGAQWQHHTKRGPGGHKVYSHSLCAPCARAYRIGRYCPLCDRSFIAPKGTMQLVICKLCDRQHHQECVRPLAPALNVLDYTCGECRRGGITSRSAAVRLAPRTIATLFMAKRRFNKYAHRQYMQSRMKAESAEAEAEDADVADSTDVADASNDAAAEAAEATWTSPLGPRSPAAEVAEVAAEAAEVAEVPEAEDPLAGADEAAAAVAALRWD